jgi:hypothetical protein
MPAEALVLRLIQPDPAHESSQVVQAVLDALQPLVGLLEPLVRLVEPRVGLIEPGVEVLARLADAVADLT